MTPKPTHPTPTAKATTSGGSAPVPKNPLPTRACLTCRVAIYAADSPDRERQEAAFDRDHPPGPDHQPVRRLPKQKGDPK